MKLRNWLIAGALLVLGIVVYGAQQWFKPHPTIGKPNFYISASALVKEFDTNEAEATKKYVGTDSDLRVVEISGKISEVYSDSSGTTIGFETNNPIKGVRCSLDKSNKANERKFTVGDSLTLKGVCSGFLTDVICDRCIFVR